MANLYIIDIKDLKNDFAKAYAFSKKIEHSSLNFTSWEISNIHYLDVNYNELLINNTKKVISKIEKQIERKLSLTCRFNVKDTSFFYFRVYNNSDNDIVNLHYFYLIENKIKSPCAMGIITEGNTKEQILVKERMTASFLICRKRNFSERNIKYKIIERPSNKSTCKYQLQLIPNNQENVFFLRKTLSPKYFIPCEVDDRGINVSQRFFPLLKIDNPNVYLTLASNTKQVCGTSIVSKPKRNAIIYNDLLYQLASKDHNIEWQNDNIISDYCNKNSVMTLPTMNIVVEILIIFARYCYSTICKGETKQKKKYIEKYILQVIEDTSLLATCIFLSFWCSMKKNNKTDIRVDALLMDAEDYADGLLQIIENAVKHAGGGYFCFRIHSADNYSKLDSSEYLKKYMLDPSKDKYYLEAIVSDYNEEYGITGKFIKYLNDDKTKDENEREYSISNELVSRITNTFSLSDLFNYDSNDNTTFFWAEFYKNSKNLTSHYGLLIFKHLVEFAQGVFKVTSSNNVSITQNDIYSNNYNLMKVEGKKEPHIPGTQYEILLPMEVAQTTKDTGLNYTLKMDSATKPWSCVWIGKESFESLLDNKILSSPDSKNLIRPALKNKKVIEIYKNFLNSYKTKGIDEEILCFDVNNISLPLAAEIFAKAFILLLSDESVKFKYFALKNATDQFLNTFIRIFSLLYLKSRQSSLMIGRQVYLCSAAAKKEILFYDNMLTKSLAATKNIAVFGRGEPTREFKFLERQAEKANEIFNEQETHIVSPLPFDVIIDGVFKDKVKSDLENDIQNDDFGCCLKNIHMKVGSKIHIHGNYYEASLLFSNSNYISRFSYFIFEKIFFSIKNTFEQNKLSKIVLVGYEAYSEALILDLKRTITDNMPSLLPNYIDYTIYYENNRKKPFSRWNEIKADQNTKFVIVVPIGSTLTTHEKIVADLLRQKLHQNSLSKDNILSHFAVILIRNNDNITDENGCRKIEKIFWKSFYENANGGHVIYNNDNIGAESKINFFVSVENEWQLPNECKYCFPNAKKIYDEEPLIQANRSSVVPITMYGRKSIVTEKITSSSYIEDETLLSPLKDSLCYGHYTRNKGNHFRFYFQTDRIVNTILNTQTEAFDEWLNEISKLSEESSSNKIIFNFIVAPLHKTNALFVNKVNGAINAKQIIWLDTKKEYRDNIRAKYSNLTSLVQNMAHTQSDEDVCLKFHFVDDTITSGKTINRAKSLINSLFYDIPNFNSKIHIEVFSSVILLLNRCSVNSKRNYASLDNFKSYIDLNVSVMRSHYDACVPCKNYKNYYKTIKEGTATNLLNKLSIKHAKNFLAVDEADFIKPIEENEGFNVLVATHRLNNILDSMGGNKNNASDIYSLIWKELNQICLCHKEDTIISYNRLCSILKVISRPFVSYRHSVLKASTKILLEIFDYFVFDSKQNIISKKNIACKMFFDSIINNTILHEDFILLIMSCLTELNSTILIRPFVIEKLFSYRKKYNFSEKNFFNNYALCVKHILYLGGRDNLSSWLENHVLNGFQPFDETTPVKETLNNSYEETGFRLLLLLENTLTIRDAIRECYKANNNTLEEIKYTLTQYYCKNYRDLLGYTTEEDMNYKLSDHISNVFMPMLKFYELLTKKSPQIIEDPSKTDYYKDFINIIKSILGVNHAILMIETNSGINRIYPDKTVQANNSSVEQLLEYTLRDIDLNSFSKNNIGDTVFCVDEETVIIKLTSNSETQENFSNYPNWYIAFNSNERETIKLIKNIRNLLAMRWEIVTRLNEDFDNNIIGKFLFYKEQFQKLGTDKSGSHTPYEQLSIMFSEIKEMMDIVTAIPTEASPYRLNSYFANQYKLIADSLISKWYVHSIMNTYPENMEPNMIQMCHPKPLEYFKDVLQVLKFSSADNMGTPVYCNRDIQWNIPWERVKFSAPHRCSFMWCCAFQSLIFNALHHGYNYETENDTDITDVYVEYEDDYFIIKNRMKDNSKIDDTSVTLSALTYFFDSYYGKNSFKYNAIDREDGLRYFEVKIPCVVKKGDTKND